MKNDNILDLTEIRKAITQIKAPDQLFEIRVIGGQKPYSGYFKDVETLIKAFDTVDLRKANVYITLNSIKKELYSRQQADALLAVKTTTSDKEVEKYDWLFIDLDPTRASGISSTDEELQAAAQMAQKIYVFLKGLGFREPIKAFSGNGYHLLYKIDIENTKDNSELIKCCLEILDDMFSDEKVKVDTTNFNPARICKLYGTLAQKGRNSSERPHRMSMIDGDIKVVEVTPVEYLKKLAKELNAKPKAEKYNNYAPTEFNLDEFLSNNGITYKEQPGDGCTIYRLDNCPFDSNHTDGDSKIFHYNDGAIAFKCHHDSCSQYKWQDVRMKFDPDAYNKNDTERDKSIEEGWKKHNRDKKLAELRANQQIKFKTISEILDEPTPENEYVKTGISEIDKRMHGLIKGGLSVWSGLRASAKSTILSQIALNAVNDDHSVIFYSGELTAKRFTDWFLLQAAGRECIEKRIGKYGEYSYVPAKAQGKISKWIGNRFYLYNNNYGSDYKKLIEALKIQIEQTKADLVIIDNLMTINLFDVNSNEFAAQTILMKQLHEFAGFYNCHIAIVAHPRKTVSFLRLIDISGTGNIANLVDSAFIVHRMSHDFEVGYRNEFMDLKDKSVSVKDGKFEGATNIIEIAKDRENGTQDEFVKLWYETETRRIMNSPVETKKYKWTSEWLDASLDNPFISHKEAEL